MQALAVGCELEDEFRLRATRSADGSLRRGTGAFGNEGQSAMFWRDATAERHTLQLCRVSHVLVVLGLPHHITQRRN